MGSPEFDAGYGAGYAAGRQEGFAEGHRAGFFEGHRAGWEQGLRDAGVAPPAPAGPARAPAPSAGPSQSAPPLIVPARPAASRWASSAEGPPILRPTAEVADERQAARRRAKRSVQNANIALYAASLLIVAAAALFLASGAADSARVTVLALVTALFYSAGLIVHSRVPRLRPAAVALTGTGLALLPVTGLAVDVILVHHPAITWLLTSVLGLVAFGAAAVRLESRILVYVSLTFAFSAAWSGAAALGGAIAIDFAAILVLAAVLGTLSTLRPRWIPPIILRSVIRLHPFVAPSVFVAATVAWFALERWQYPALVVALCLYFAVSVVVRGPLAVRRFSWWSARVTAVVAAGSGVWQGAEAGLFGSGIEASDGAAVAAAGVVALQVVAVGLRRRRLVGVLSLSQRMVLLEQSAAVVAVFVIFLGELALRAVGFGGTPVALFTVSALAIGAAQFVAWWHGRATEALPVVVFAMVALAHDPLGSGASAVLSSAAASYWLARAVWPARPAGDTSGWGRMECAAAARVASLWMVPAVADALLPFSVAAGERTAALATATALTGVAQLIGTALVAGLGRREFARGPVSGVMTAAAVVGSVVAATAEPPSHWILHLVAVVGCCLAALAVATTLFDYSADSGARGVALGEWLPTLLLSPLSIGLIGGDRWGAANATLATLTVVCAASAWRSSSLKRRWAFGWLSRAAGSALVLTLFHALERDGWVLSVLGQQVALWHVLVMVSLAQLCVPLVAEARALRQTERSFRWALEDAAIVLAVTGAACAALTPTRGFSLPGSTGPGPLTATAVVGFAIAAALTGFLLRRRPAAIAIAPIAFVLSVLLAHVDLRLVEIITAVYSAYAAAMALVLRKRVIRGAHLLAARAFPLLLVALVAQDATASPTVVSVALALGLAAQHVVRRFMRSAADLPFQKAAYWSGIVAQLALPVLYAATSRGEAIGGRWVLLGEALLVVASVLLTLRDQPKAGYAGIMGLLIALVSAGPAVRFPSLQFLSQPLLNGTSLVLTACLLSMAHVAGMVLWDGVRQTSGRRLYLWPWTAGAGAFAFAAVVAGVPEQAWVLGVALAACSAALFAASGVWRHVAGVAEVAFPLASLVALAAGIAVGHSVFAHEAAPWGDVLAVLVGGVVPAGVGLAVRWGVVWAAQEERLVALARLGADPVRRWSLAGTAAVALLMAARFCWEPRAAPVLPFLAVALVGLAVSEAPSAWRRLTAELGLVVVVAAVQRGLFAGSSGESAFWLAQWYVVLAAVVALMRYIGHDQRLGAVWLAFSATLATLTGFVVAFSADTPQQVWLLVAFAGLVGAGVTAGDRRFTAWGAIGVLACVLWAVRAYPYLLLGALGLALIGFAVWWLIRAPRGTLLP